MTDIKSRIESLKKEKNAVILAHYYVPGEVQEIADYIGDSFYLSKIAKDAEQDTIVFCGVSFMGESAKILSPGKQVLMPDITAGCPMAYMAQVEKIEEVRRKYDDVAVVCYINSTGELKKHSDVCVTSANAMKIVQALPNKNIYFIPDENLGRYVASKVTDKHFIFNDGFCPLHKEFSKTDIEKVRKAHPGALLLVHPECRMEVLEDADYIGSTSGIIEYASESDAKEFIIGTEPGVMYELERRNPGKKFYPLVEGKVCPDMKKITLEKVLKCMEEGTGVVEVTEELRNSANASLDRMLELAR
ncbi:MAG: quinolinate synthase NadA [Lachnospiraceae bacterium]|jgi:quinolinate synthase|nr:quinolinate synthase NadA [Lachnospiraceae bacterium]